MISAAAIPGPPGPQGPPGPPGPANGGSGPVSVTHQHTTITATLPIQYLEKNCMLIVRS